MPEEQATTLEAENIEADVNTTVEPDDSETQDTDVSTVSKETETDEAGKTTLPESLKDVPEGFIKKFGEIDLDNPANANLVKSAYHSEKAMNEANNKLAEAEKKSQEVQFTQAKQQVSSEKQLLDYNYQNAVLEAQNKGNEALSRAFNDLQSKTIDAVEYARIVSDENTKFINVKTSLDSIYSQEEGKIKTKDSENLKTRITTEFKTFEESNKEKLSVPYNRELIDSYKAENPNSPHDLPIVLKYAENYLKSYLKHQATQAKIKAGVETDAKGMTTTVGKGSSTTTSKSPTIEQLQAMRVSNPKAYAKWCKT